MKQTGQQKASEISIPRFQIAAIGEVLWDVFLTGPRFGGAPANFACSVANLGRSTAQVSMVSGVGRDELGRAAIESLFGHRVSTSFVQTKDFPTGQVLVELDSEGRASYEFASNTAWDNLSWDDTLSHHAAQLDAICFGTLGQRSEQSRETIQRFVSNTRPSCLRVFDVNLRPPYFDEPTIQKSLQLANVLKMNDDELPVLAKIFGCSDKSSLDVMRQLANDFGLHAVALTQGAEGASLVRGTEESKQLGVPCEIVDTVGAGDAFTAVLVLGLLDNSELAEINRQACEVASFVCSQSGATPELHERFVR